MDLFIYFFGVGEFVELIESASFLNLFLNLECFDHNFFFQKCLYTPPTTSYLFLGVYIL